jgi:hypothetical protein
MTEKRLADYYDLDTINYHRRRKNRARILCEGLGCHAEYASQPFISGTRLAFFSSYEEAISDLISVAVSKGVKFVIYEVIKVDDRWAISYKTIASDKFCHESKT